METRGVWCKSGSPDSSLWARSDTHLLHHPCEQLLPFHQGCLQRPQLPPVPCCQAVSVRKFAHEACSGGRPWEQMATKNPVAVAGVFASVPKSMIRADCAKDGFWRSSGLQFGMNETVRDLQVESKQLFKEPKQGETLAQCWSICSAHKTSQVQSLGKILRERLSVSAGSTDLAGSMV